ncbi:iron-containing alcohol dehydrogenase [Chloroflexota bacterium]
MEGTVDYVITVKQHQKRLFHSLIIAEWQVESDFLLAGMKGMMYNLSFEGRCPVMTTFYLPTRIIFGAGSFNQLGAEARRLGEKAMLITGRNSMCRTGVLDRVVEDLKNNGVDTLVFDKVLPNPRASTIDEGAGIARQEGVELIIGMGGGSAMDTAKGIVLASTGTKPTWDYIGTDIKVSGPVLPLILVPTMAATGSEANGGASITRWETREKAYIFTPYMFPRVSIIDPELTLTVPKEQTATGGVDIFCHAVEGYITTQEPSLVNDGIIEAVLRAVVELLPRVLAKLDDIEMRTELSWASTIACSQLIALGGGYGPRTCHSISNFLGGYYDVAHGDCLAAILPIWMRYTLPVKSERFRALGRNVFDEEDGIAATEKWLEKVGRRLRLRDLGVEPEHFEEIAVSCIRTDARTKAHPKVLDVDAIKQIYQDSY